MHPSSILNDIYHLENDNRLQGQENYHNVFVNHNTEFYNAVATHQVSRALYIYDLTAP